MIMGKQNIDIDAYVRGLEERYNVIVARGKCNPNQGVARKLKRKIEKGKKGNVLA